MVKKYYLNLILVVLAFGCAEPKDENFNIDQLASIIKKETPSLSILATDSLINSGDYKGDILGKLYFKKATLYSSLQRDSEAKAIYLKALSIFKKSNNKLQLAKTHLLLGSANIFLEKADEATENLLEALEISKSINNKKVEANVFNTLSHLYYKNKNFDKAVSYSLKAAKIQVAEKDSLALSSTYNNLAIIYKNRSNLIEAKRYNLLALELNKNNKDQIGIAKSYNNLGQVYELLEKDNEAYSYYYKSYQINKSLKILNSTALRNLAVLFIENKSLDSARYYYFKAIKIEEEANRPKILKTIYQDLLRISIEKNERESSISYQKKIDSLSQLVLITENEQKLKSLEIQYEAKASEKELEQEVKNNKKNQIIFLVVLVLLAMLGLFLYQRNKAAKLKLEKEKLLLEQRVLRSQMNPHFIFNTLSAIQNSLLDNDSIKSAFYLSRFAKLVRQNFDFINHREISLAEEIDSLTNYLETQQLRFKDKFDFAFEIQESLDVEEVRIPPLLLQPFVENSIEHGFKNKKEKGHIKISISSKNNAIHYSIVDDGIGYDVSKKNVKDHAIDIFKKRMRLLDKGIEENFKITSNHNGTVVNFYLGDD